MYHFDRTAPLDTTTHTPPSPDDRTDVPLSQGFVLVMISTVAAEYCSPEIDAALEQIDPEAWYHGQLLETVLNHFADQDPELPAEIGKTIYYALRSQFCAMGLKTPDDVIATLPMLWQHVTRGDSGTWWTKQTGPGSARLELCQPYNVEFERGAVIGALEAFDARGVVIEHTVRRTDGAERDVFVAQWQT